MAFPPNYRQERQARDRAKLQKAAQKQAERDARKADRKQEQDGSAVTTDTSEQKD